MTQAGSGTLLLSLANKIGVTNCSIYSQDISQKSTQFLRINLILNKLVHSLSNVIEGNTLSKPEHKNPKNNDELMEFDYIVSNPPFKTDFSNLIEDLKVDRYNRFFAGLPNVPKKKKDSMAVYETFIQHILASLADNGKAAIVVPTGFTTATTGIPRQIRKKIVDKNWLRGVIHMPSNIFATTGTSVSIIFIDKTKVDDKIILMDASRLGESIKLEEGQRTVLSVDERNKIMFFFKERKEEAEFSVLVEKKEVKLNNYIIQAGQYVELKEEELDFDVDERLNLLQQDLVEVLEYSNELSTRMMNSFMKEGNKNEG